MQGQMYFTDHCLSRLPDLRGKQLLDVGCGNGVQTFYVNRTYQPTYVYGIDVSELHIRLANEEKQRSGAQQIDFALDDAQAMKTIADDSFDVAMCTESAHHYPQKELFLSSLKRVLRPGGYFLIADLLSRKKRPPSMVERKLALYHWPRERYLDTFSSLGLELLREEDLTDLIIPGFHTADQWFEKPQMTSWIPYHLSKVFGRALVKIYIHQLKHTHQYSLMIGRKRAVAKAS
jgi:2-polyprenyl-3-methyl-5-hydroxy-6-metoxy-1,4-benzoquinol methylase